MPSGDIVALLPWLCLKNGKELSIGPVSFVSFKQHSTRMTAISGQGCKDLNKIISSYKDIEGEPIKSITLLLLDGNWRLTRNRDEAVISEVTRIAALAAMAKNEFFREATGRYANATLFEPIFQEYREGVPRLAFGLRRRAGNVLDVGYEHGRVNITRPIECQGIRDVEIDAELAKAVWNARETPVGRRIITALSFFCIANTDSPTMESDAEVILMASAFDQVFEIERNNAHELAKELGSLLNDYGAVSVERAMRNRKIWLGTNGVTADEQKAWKVHQKWIEEFYHLRNEKAHGEKKRKDDEWGWSRDEHLILALFIFPLVVKRLLEKEGCYSLTNIDKQLCDAIDVLLATKPGRWSHKREDRHDTTIWSKICGRMSDRARREIIDEVNAAEK